MKLEKLHKVKYIIPTIRVCGYYFSINWWHYQIILFEREKWKNKKVTVTFKTIKVEKDELLITKTK